MDFRKVVRPKFKGQYCSLTTLADLLKTSPEALFEDACEGRLQVFAQKPADARIYSVHTDALDLEDAILRLDKFLRRVPAPDQAEAEPVEMSMLDSEESQPLNMSAFAIEGLELTRYDCQKIKEKEVVTQFLFVSGIRANYSLVEVVHPIRGHFRFKDKQTLRPEGWRLACYGPTHPVEFYSGVGYSRPQGIALSRDSLFVTADNVDRYINLFDPEVILSKFIEDGNIAVEKLPSYVSKKLIYLIEANQKFWRTARPDKVGEYQERAQKAKKYLLAPDFQLLFAEDEISPGQLKFTTTCITPVFARSDKERKGLEAWGSYLSPELLCLLVLAERAWGGSRVRLEDSKSYPKRAQVTKLARELGLKGDLAKYALTLVRPEEARLGRPEPEVSRAGVLRFPAPKNR